MSIQGGLRRPVFIGVFVFLLAMALAVGLIYRIEQERALLESDPQALGLRVALGLLVGALLGWLARMLVGMTLGERNRQTDVSVRTGHVNALNQQLEATLDALPDLMFEMDLNGRYLDYRAPSHRQLSVQPGAFIGKTLYQVMPVKEAELCLSALRQANQDSFSQGQQVQLTWPDGPHWFELSASRKAGVDGAEPSIVALARDITDRKDAEAKVVRLTKLYSALSQCNQAIVRCRNQAELFPIICREAVNFGGMKMAWIGRLDAGSRTVNPVACYGTGTQYLEGIDISADAAISTGRGPVGTAIRENRPYWCQDFQTDEATAPWRERAAGFGWGATAALPLHLKGQVIGAFVLYSNDTGALDEADQNLLLEMAMDVSFALDRFADELEREKVRESLLESEERYRKAFQTSPDSIYITRLGDGTCLDVNRGFERITGWTRDEVVGKTAAQIHIWRHPQDRARLRDCLAREGHCVNLEADFVRKDGTISHGLMSAELVRFKDVDCVLSITRDITEKKLAEARIEHLAHFDQLTGLPNRGELHERFKYLLQLAQRSGEKLAVVFLDLDHFKNINDSLGHSIGDQLLMEVSLRFKAVLREQDTLSRLGGDEFILLLPGTDETGAAQVAAKLIAAMAQPCRIECYELVSTVSIGIALYPHDGQDFETLAKNADTAMYCVKQASRNDFRFFTQEMQAQSTRVLQLVNALRHALARNELHLHYQPQLAMQDGRIVGVEALLRWQHPELGLISPVEFVPIAENSGQILEIGEWVLRTAVNQLKRWMQDGLAPMVMAVNLSAVQFRHPNLIDLVTRILDEAGVPPQYLELELTEATAMDDPLAAIAVMNQLFERGVRMSIDDFGTGYSSLSYLKKFKVYQLKIDQSFVRDISDDPDDKAIVTAIINLASSLGVRTIAEGVETASQLAFLRLQGCDEVQGNYFSAPLPKDQLEAFVRGHIS